MGAGGPKQWRDLAGRPLVAHALETLRPVGLCVLVIHPDDRAEAQAIAGSAMLVEGGASRAASVKRQSARRRSSKR